MDRDELTRRLVHPNGPYAGIEVVAATGSTNADLLARPDPVDRTVLIAEEQTAGEGRRGRSWISPSGGLYLSVHYRPGVPAHRLPWLTLLAGVALVNVAASVGVSAGLKWPNDLLLGPDQRKGAGVLASTHEHGIVLGIGLNVRPLPGDVPLAPGGLQPTSLADEGADEADRTELAVRLLTELDRWEAPWRDANGDPLVSGLHEEYARHCVTLGQEVRVELAGDVDLLGTARYLEADGTLVVRDGAGHDHVVPAGDVVHLRATGGGGRPR
ncbi:biotin--[acetyl-CoA-carboxylase] ligase [Actinocrispum wychmicini]|uniref:biotin--[biotin carboxyl-carrier protein] ligase n=1 Tax=Actinocrispum wychmicini TaxID=1213861 RepID=A0A4R2KGP7_9PSEU|nr:biotin--[acetyl-CoA-carboxylase] ligase [Actinocrispum wychmicini]TCO65615.1 BirA family biotin operon repressor/biotin-[acetyl-CoA-carboxylase] ligase [Actinocrispum wychmicini]